jgi:hypothetical protein
VTLALRVVSVTVGPLYDTDALEDRALCRTGSEGRVPVVLLEYAHLDILLFMSAMSVTWGSRLRCGPQMRVNMHTKRLYAQFPSKYKVSMYECRKRSLNKGPEMFSVGI